MILNLPAWLLIGAMTLILAHGVTRLLWLEWSKHQPLNQLSYSINEVDRILTKAGRPKLDMDH